MKQGKNKISRQKGIEICADLLFAGQSRKEILQQITEKHKCCESTVDQWLKAARPIVLIRQREAEAIRTRVTQEEIEASAKRLNLSRERILEELAKVAYSDPRNLLTVDGGLKDTSQWDDNTAGAVAGIESYDEKARDTGEVLGTVRKIKSWDKIRAIERICKIMGYDAPEKKEIKADVNLNELPITFE